MVPRLCVCHNRLWIPTIDVHTSTLMELRKQRVAVMLLNTR